MCPKGESTRGKQGRTFFHSAPKMIYQAFVISSQITVPCILTGYPIIPLPIHPPHFHKNDFIKMLVLLCLPHSGARHVLPLMIWWPLSVSPAVFSPVSSSHPGSLQFHGSYAPFHIPLHLEEAPFLLSCSFCFVFAWVTSTQQFPFYEFIWRWTCTWVKRSVSKASLFITAKDCSLLKVRQYS